VLSSKKQLDTPSTLHIEGFGISLGTSKGKIIVKKEGNKLFSTPKTLCDRIIIASKGVNISSDLIYLCANNGIGIDFIECAKERLSMPYASLYGTKFAYAKSFLKQLEILNSPKKFEFAKAFVTGKVKNQTAYLKRLNKYRKTLTPFISQCEDLYIKMDKNAKNENELMGFEGMISVAYWSAIQEVVKEKTDFPGRITQKASDPLNAALNYGYAILYGRIKYHAIRASLALHISFLHSLNENKPTLVFDLIEEFRVFVVDKTVISLINRGKKLNLNKQNRLDKESRRLIAKSVIERINSPVKTKNASVKIDTAISKQAYKLSRAIKENGNYQPFIGEY